MHPCCRRLPPAGITPRDVAACRAGGTTGALVHPDSPDGAGMEPRWRRHGAVGRTALARRHAGGDCPLAQGGGWPWLAAHCRRRMDTAPPPDGSAPAARERVEETQRRLASKTARIAEADAKTSPPDGRSSFGKGEGLDRQHRHRPRVAGALLPRLIRRTQYFRRSSPNRAASARSKADCACPGNLIASNRRWINVRFVNKPQSVVLQIFSVTGCSTAPKATGSAWADDDGEARFVDRTDDGDRPRECGAGQPGHCRRRAAAARVTRSDILTVASSRPVKAMPTSGLRAPQPETEVAGEPLDDDAWLKAPKGIAVGVLLAALFWAALAGLAVWLLR